MIGWALDTLLATSALLLIVMVAREPVRRQFGATAAYALWLIPAARVAMPPITQTVERVVPADPVAAAPFALTDFPPTSTANVLAEPSLIDQLGGWSNLLIAIWLLGAAAMLLQGLAIYRRQSRRVLGSSVQLARLGRVRLVRSELVSGPMAFGIFSPVVVVPIDFDQRYDARQRRLALDHELSHHRAGDLWANLVAYVLLCLQWFNPLAWVAHSAFRFDQEAACDARVLGMIDGSDRAAYGQTIAKAASGRALLFAGALDRPKTLSRRLQSMLISPNPRRRLAGRFLIAAGLMTALPLTATWATRTVDRVAPTPPVPPLAPLPASAPTAPKAPIAPFAAQAAVAPMAPDAPEVPDAIAPPAPPAPPVPPTRASSFNPDISFIRNDSVRIHGKTKRWEDLSAAERSEIRADTAKARRQLDREVARLPQQMANASREVEKFRNGDFQREMANARVEIRQALAELDHNAPAIRAAGQDPEALKAQVRASLREVEKMDIDKMVRESLASINPDKIAADLSQARASLAQVEARLDRLDRGN